MHVNMWLRLSAMKKMRYICNVLYVDVDMKF